MDNNDKINEVYYGRLFSETTQEELRNRVHWICKQAQGENILDVGCSQGIVSILLAREGFNVVGVDIDHEAIEYANSEKAHQQATVQENLNFINCSIFDAVLPSFEYHTIVMGEFLEHLVKPENALRKAYDLLVDHGRLIITVPFGLLKFWDHKHTFYISSLYKIITPYFSIEKLDIIGKRTCVVCTRRNNIIDSDLFSIDLSLVETMESEFENLEEKFNQNISTHIRQLKDINNEISKVRAEKTKLEKDKVDKENKFAAIQQKYAEQEKELEKNLNYYQSQASNNEKELKKVCHDRDVNIKQLSRRIAALENSTKFILGDAIVSSIKKPWKAPGYTIVLFKHFCNKVRKKKKARNTPHEVNYFNGNSSGDVENHFLDQKEWLKDLLITGLNNLPGDISKIKVAAIMDEFSFECYKHECQLITFRPDNWREVLTNEQPHFLFVESAWQGKDGLWSKKIGFVSQELTGLVKWCSDRRIPTVFWNKEDPVHFETFINTAKLFDFVFTTDINCIHRYKKALGHKRVFLLPFACQPAINNPIEKYERKDAINFAGAYYARYTERQADLATFVGKLTEFKPVEIYDRNYGKSDPNYQFPVEYKPFIVGNLPFEQIDIAYKGYRYAINLNSIKQSQTMFARRVYELLASNTITVSNFSRGVRLLFGDLVISTDNGDRLLERLRSVSADITHARKFRLAALRKVMQEHTYQDRFCYIISKIWGREPLLLPCIAMISHIQNEAEFDAVLKTYRRQSYVNKKLIIITPKDHSYDTAAAEEDVKIFSLDKLKDIRIGDIIEPNNYVATIAPEDYYGPNYLLDLALATRYSKELVIGKYAHYCWSADGGHELKEDGNQYRKVDSIPVRAAIVGCEKINTLSVEEWVTEQYTREINGDKSLSIDEFNYCKGGGGQHFSTTVTNYVDDLNDLDTGISIKTILKQAESIEGEQSAKAEDCPQITAQKLSGLFKMISGKPVSVSYDSSSLVITSTLPDEKHKYIYATKDFHPAELGFGDAGKFNLDVTPGLNVQVVFLYLDKNKERIGSIVKTARCNHQMEIPAGTCWIRFGLRIYASGTAKIKRLLLGHTNESSPIIIGRSDCLVLTNHYPSDEDLYRNGFVHRRVLKYMKQGMRVDVFRLHKGTNLSFHEFEDIDVISGGQEELDKLLGCNKYKSVLVHFLDEDMWQVLERHIKDLKILVWVHGAEIQPWHRRDFNYSTDEERQAARKKSDRRMAFWRGVLKNAHQNLKLIFVSQYLTSSVMEDLGFSLEPQQYEIVHNFIDTKLFDYQEKPSSQRKKILSIRPYASRTYANDLTVSAILYLSKKEYFNELEFRLIGDGKLFEETLAPLRGFNNVHIEQRFLTQPEIAGMHKQYGIFLCPTRMDSQGVSRDEAMSSGLVPITNRVAAIPEFVDESCGILVEAEDAVGLAEGIIRLYEDPHLFQSISKGAAQRVRRQRGLEQTINRELDLIRFS